MLILFPAPQLTNG